jgi:ABC-2 type transport system permease protein
MKSYLTYFKIRLITEFQYRASAIAGIFTQFFFGIVFIMVYFAFYQSNGTIVPPMKWQELINYLWLQQAFFAIIYPFLKDNELLDMIKNGNVAYEIIRPQNFYLKWYIKLLSKKVSAVILRFSPIIIISLILPSPYNLSAPISIINFILFIIALIISSLLSTSLILIIHILTMFTMDSKGLTSIYSAIAEIFSGSTIPIPFFPLWLQKIAYLLPFKYIGDLPFRLYSGSINYLNGIQLILLSLIWLLILIFIGFIISKKALNKAVIQGG